MNDFLDKGYEAPVTPSNYMKWEQGENVFRTLSSTITGFLYWTKDKKPVRLKTYPETIPADMDTSGRVQHFWAFVVWNYKMEAIQILEITQTTIRGVIEDYNKDSDWGDPRQYDIKVTRTGENLDTEYSTIAKPKTAVTAAIKKAYKATPINLEALFEGKDPFGKEETEGISPQDIPF